MENLISDSVNNETCSCWAVTKIIAPFFFVFIELYIYIEGNVIYA